ncbi:hypothetical protein FKM82_006023 [Ascaphus truei]
MAALSRIPELLLGDLFLLSDFLFWFGDNLLLLSQDHLNLAWGAHVRVDTPMSTVSASAHLGGLVHLDVLNDQGINIQALEFRIALSILQHV